AIGCVRSIGAAVAVVSPVAFVAHGGRWVPLDPVKTPFFNDLGKICFYPGNYLRISHAQLLGRRERRMYGADRLAIDHGQPFRWNLSRFHSRGIDVAWIHPDTKLHSCGMDRV